MKRELNANELISEQINDGSATFEILSFDNNKNVFLCVEIVYNEETDKEERKEPEFFLTKKEMEIALHHFDGINHTIIL